MMGEDGNRVHPGAQPIDDVPSPKRFPASRVTLWKMVAASLGLLALFLLRNRVVMDPLQDELACGQCLLAPQALLDLPQLAGMLALFGANLFLRSRALRILARLLLALLALVYLLDIFIYRNFFVRLHAHDVAVYGRQARLVWQQFRQTLPAWAYVAVCAGMLVTVVACLWVPRQRQRPSPAVFLLPLAVAGISAVAALQYTSGFPGMWVVRNVLAHNLRAGRAHAYDDRDVKRLSRNLLTPLDHCIAGRSQRPNIVVLIAEGWSPYHSKLFSGIRNWTPRLDAIASHGRYFTNLHAGGGNTNAGLISILQGLDIHAPVGWRLQGYSPQALASLDSSLPRRLSAEGYRTAFMTNGNLAFSGKAGWMRGIGFEEIDGHDAKEYTGLPRLSFDAVADEYLYRKALGWIDRDAGNKPWLLVLENVSSHHPYTHPLSQERSEEKAFGYMDQSMSALILELGRRGFFQNNLLVLLSDHRAMTMVTPEETAKFGMQASARIPGFALSGLIEAGAIDTPLHQSDLLPSLLAMVSPQGACAHRPIVDMFHDSPPEPRCLLHSPQSDWDTVQAYCPGADLRITLDGSRSSISEGAPADPAAQRQVLDAIATRRLFPAYNEILELPPRTQAAPVSTRVRHPALVDGDVIAASIQSPLEVAEFDPRSLPKVGGCNIETFDRYGFDQVAGPVRVGNAIDAAVGGWVIDTDAGDTAPDVELVMYEWNGTGRWRIGSLTRYGRPDIVSSQGGNRDYLQAGFRGVAPTSWLPVGSYGLAVVYGQGDRRRVCGAGRRFELVADTGVPPASSAAAAH